MTVLPRQLARRLRQLRKAAGKTEADPAARPQAAEPAVRGLRSR